MKPSPTNLNTARVTVRFAHMWPFPSDAAKLGVTPLPYYNVVDGDYTHGSTVTIPTLKAMGLTVEVVC